MEQGDGFLDGFRREMRKEGAAGLNGEQIAVRLCDHLAADRDQFGAPIADLQQWALNVEIELKTGALWTIECLKANAYHFYPAHIRPDGTAVWLNVWVADDMKLDELVDQMRKEIVGERHDG